MKTINGHKGFTLIELLISMAILGVVLASLASLFVSQSKHHTAQNEILEMQGNARAAMEFVTRTMKGLRRNVPLAHQLEIRYEGTQNSDIVFTTFHNETEPANTGNNNDIVKHRFVIRHDHPSDGPNIFTYGRRWNETIIDRPDRDPLALNITRFTLQRLTSAGVNTTNWENTARINITITAQTARPLPTTGRHGTITLTSSVYLRN